MTIVPLSQDRESLYCACLEDWSDEIKEAGDRKARWLEKMRARGLRVHLALDDRGEVGGMIQCVPIEEAFVEGQGLYFIHCIWVHGHKQGRGNFQKKGMGAALLAAAEEDVRALGAKGMAAWGSPTPSTSTARGCAWGPRRPSRRSKRPSPAASRSCAEEETCTSGPHS
jgi:GNAT superfamily N-acetyltransferase